MKDHLNPCDNCKRKDQSQTKEPCKTCMTDKDSKAWEPEEEQQS